MYSRSTGRLKSRYRSKKGQGLPAPKGKKEGKRGRKEKKKIGG